MATSKNLNATLTTNPSMPTTTTLLDPITTSRTTIPRPLLEPHPTKDEHDPSPSRAQDLIIQIAAPADLSEGHIESQ